MEINRIRQNSGVEQNRPEAETDNAKFNAQASAIGQPETMASAPPSANVTRTDLADAGKRDEILKQSFDRLVSDAGNQLGIPISSKQKEDLIGFLQDDPMLRSKLLNYLGQIAK
jgi:hypothetical protein